MLIILCWSLPIITCYVVSYWLNKIMKKSLHKSSMLKIYRRLTIVRFMSYAPIDVAYGWFFYTITCNVINYPKDAMMTILISFGLLTFVFLPSLMGQGHAFIEDRKILNEFNKLIKKQSLLIEQKERAEKI